jgi:hypothetical protein
MGGDTLQTFQKKFQNNFFSLKKSRFHVDLCYKKIMRRDTLQTFQKKFQNNFFSLNKSISSSQTFQKKFKNNFFH